jgi:chromosome segregation ATPase
MSKSKSSGAACVFNLACALLATGCGAHASAPEAAAPSAVDRQELAELDRLIAEVRTNLEATRTSAQQAESYEATTAAQLADFRTKVESAAPTGGNERQQPAKVTASEGAPQDAIHAALAAFEAKSKNATAVTQLRKAQVAAREARLARLTVQRQQVAHPPVAASASSANAQLNAAQAKETAAKAEVERLQVAEQQAELQAAQALDRYQRLRQGGAPGASDAKRADAAGTPQ